MGKSKLVRSIVIGALTGAALSMLDRNTREHTIESVLKAKDTVIHLLNNREELQQFIEGKVGEIQNFYEKATEDVSVIVEKIDELKDLPDSIQTLVTDTKDAFTTQQKHLN